MKPTIEPCLCRTDAGKDCTQCECCLKQALAKMKAEMKAEIRDEIMAEMKELFNEFQKELLKEFHKSHENERVILYHVSGEDPQYKTVTKEKTLRETVVDEAIKEIMTRPPEEERAIGMKYFRKFKGVPGFYTKFDSFIRQVRRSQM